MSEAGPGAELREAVYELHRYLCDELAPMMVTDSVLVLLEHPPALVAPQIHAWVGAQHSRRDSKYATSDYLYHAIKKLHLLCEFELIDAKRLREYLSQLAGHLLAYCPEEEREALRQQIGRLGQAEAVLTSTTVENIYQAGGPRPAASAQPAAPAQAGAGAPAAGGRASDEAVSRGLRRFSLLLERLGRSEAIGLPAPQAAAETEQIRLQALVTAAVQARDEAELQEHLRRLGGTGIDARPEQLFRMLGRGLPAWNIPLVALAPMGATDAYPSRPMEAMRKMVALADSPEEGARRFNDLVQAAIELFNEGSLPRAATMLELAERLTTDKGLHLDVVQAIRKRAHEALKEDRLRKYAERAEDRPVLLRVMNFFPAMTPEGLLRQLHEESKRERRWLLLLLLEVHGAAARVAALQDLESFLRGEKTEPHGYHQRNLIYLLRRIPVGDGGPSAKELEILDRSSRPDHPAIVVREAIRALGPLAHATAERLLLARLRELEAAASRLAPTPPGAPSPLLELLDHTCSALALQRTPGALGAVVQHGLLEEPALGDTMARLDPLGAQDLSGIPDAVERLLQTLRERLPKKILGLVIQKRESLPHLIRALAGTPMPAVRAALEEIASRYTGQDLAAEAIKALEGIGAAARRTEQTAPGLSGDIELFGLPNLFQTLCDSQVTGALSLRSDRGRVCGTVRFLGGKIRSCEYLHLKGEDALYQLFEKTEARKFAFQAEPAPAGAGEALIEVLPMLLEAVRRHDELQQARALVPDGTRLRSTQTKPRRLQEEEDVDLTQAVWSKAAAGSTPEQCEAAVPADAFRIRRLLAHWVETGALQLAAAAAA